MNGNIRNTALFFPVMLFLISLFSCGQSTESSQKEVQIDLNQLLGKWVAVDNPKNVIELTERRMFSFYNGVKLADESLMIYQQCVPRCLSAGMDPMPCIVTDGKRAENCFQIIELSDQYLTYSLIGNSQKIMKFKRM